MRPREIAARAFEKLRDGHVERGAPALEEDALLAMLAEEMRRAAGAYRVPEGKRLAGVRAVFRDGGKRTVALDEGSVSFHDHLPLSVMMTELVRWYLFHSGHDDPPPTAEQLLWAIGTGWARMGRLFHELGPVYEPVAEVERAWGENRRRFRHPDGRVWAIEPMADELWLTMWFVDDPDPVERKKTFASPEECQAAARELIAEQLADGFEEDWVITAAGATRMGDQRVRNEDRLFIDRDRGLFIVADAAKDPLAAELVIEHLRKAVEEDTSDGSEVLRRGLEAADRALSARIAADPQLLGTFAMPVALLIRGKTAHVAHCEGARLYALRPDVVELLTPDLASEAPKPWPLDPSDMEKLPVPPLVQHPPVGSGEVWIGRARFDVHDGDAWILSSDLVDDPTPAIALPGATDPFDRDERSLQRIAARLICGDDWGDDATAVCVAVRSFAPQPTFPKRLLGDLSFAFAVPRGERPAEGATPRELAELSDEVVLEAGEVRVRFELWDPEAKDRLPLEVTLTASNGASFTTRELLGALADAVARAQRDGRTLGDRRFFEGVELTRTDGGVPIYDMILGS